MHRTTRLAAAALLAGASVALSLTPASAQGLPVVKRTAGIEPPPIGPIGIEAPATGLPVPGNMAYFGGPVMTNPKAYLIFWGFDSNGTNDPNGVQTLLTNFFKGVGGSSWAGVVTQYYQTVNGVQTHIGNPTGQLAGTWVDTTGPGHDNLSEADYAGEAARAVAHFGGTVDPNANYIVATPKNMNDAGFNSGSYCAYHGYTSSSNFPALPKGIAYTVLPYIPNAGSGCGAGMATTPGTNDGVTMVAGHEYLEAVTDPGVFVDSSHGGWADNVGNENADKCAYVTVGPGSVTVAHWSTGDFAVQGTWSNQDLSGTGACSTG